MLYSPGSQPGLFSVGVLSVLVAALMRPLRSGNSRRELRRNAGGRAEQSRFLFLGESLGESACNALRTRCQAWTLLRSLWNLHRRGRSRIVAGRFVKLCSRSGKWHRILFLRVKRFERRIIRADMDNKSREALSLTYEWAQHQSQLLEIVFPAMQEIARCLIDGRKPTPEQVDRWDALLPEVTRRMQQLNEDAELVRQVVTPLFRFDA